MNVGWPQGILLVLMALGLVNTAIHDQEPRTGSAAIYHFPITVCSAVFNLWLLYWGGFFS